MTLSSQLTHQVPATIRARGQPYYHRGAVRNLQGDAFSVQAIVQGSEKYQVELEREGRTVRASCTCPYFEDRAETCKHIWATLLAADERGLLRGSDETGPLDLELNHSDAAAGAPPEWLDEAEEGLDWEPPRPQRRPAQRPMSRPRSRNWRQQLAGLTGNAQRGFVPTVPPWSAGQEILYVIDVENSSLDSRLILEIAQRSRKKDGNWSKPKTQGVPFTQLSTLPDATDRRILTLLRGAQDATYGWGGYAYSYANAPSRYTLPAPLLEELAPLIGRMGRCFLRRAAKDKELHPVQWDEGGPWDFGLDVAGDGKNYEIQARLRRGEESLDLAQVILAVPGGLVIWDRRMAPLRDFGAFDWMALLRREGPLRVPAGQKDDFLAALLKLPQIPPLQLPADWQYEEVRAAPKPRLAIRKANRSYHADRLSGELSFDYAGALVAADDPGRGVFQKDQRRLVLRDRAAEQAAAAELLRVGWHDVRGPYGKRGFELAPRYLPRVVRTLTEAGWHVEAEGKLYRQPGNFYLQVSSGVDWFELHGAFDYGDQAAPLPELLAALRRGENAVRLDDGTYGILPEEWLKKYGKLAGLGEVEEDHLRFQPAQVGLLDALLASQPQVDVDERFAQLRDELKRFEGVHPAEAPPGFTGQLRGYQKVGLGWLHFLEQFRFGGCLADDMGLGKTVMVLALLESRRQQRRQKAGQDGRPGPSLVVVPRSLVFNWIQEAARFTPTLRVLDHTGAGRQPPGGHFDDYDVILTTYGTLRRDALHLKDVHFDYCILDESQAIKNAATESAKAVRLIRCEHRLALSGTPIENHLGELWSLFDFLNPGLLGRAGAFKVEGGLRHPDEETRQLLARALRPFILRRTKEQVAKDLPPKMEQTIYCDLEGAQRKQYDDLRRHYREALRAKVDRDGIKKSSIQILEALLRLRQAACHPGLIDKDRTGDSSAKLDLLLGQLEGAREGGHKALVFSQFTSLLAIVRERLDDRKVPYLYLDGRTRDRASRVEQFQNDPESKLFLISLKAGGLGLNLTAAEYVFLLDPWWNPAVEAQAIDRAHRIGQTKPVFAYRIIARDTVEEKVLELQKSKRDLADAIINGDNSLMRNLDWEDLDLLLS